jgi:FemAB-related protein (PEP-CTERM system-associated)
MNTHIEPTLGLAPPVATSTLVLVDDSPAAGPDWNHYVASRPEGSVFQDARWARILQETFGFSPHYLVARREGRIVGILPLVEVKTWLFGHSLSSLPFCSWAGPLADDDAAHRALDVAATALAKQLGVAFLEYRCTEPSRPEWPTQDIYVRFRKDIAGDHEANLNAVPRKQRAMIRKGLKNGLTGSPGTTDEFYNLYADNVHRHGTPPVPKQFFESMRRNMGDDCRILIVRDALGAPVSGVLSLYHRNEVFPYYAGDVPRARELAANDFKYWAVMRDAADSGYRSFDFGRSKKGTGSFDFKRNWGFEPAPLSYQYCLLRQDAVPSHNPSNPRYRLMIDTWRKLPRWAVNRIGPMIVRGLG